MNDGPLFERIAKDYLPRILGWAIKKTGDRDAGEALAQDVFVQFFSAASKADGVEKPENLLWKVAHYCWCSHLRRSAERTVASGLDENIWDSADFVDDLVLEENKSSQMSKMRREISNLSRQHREAMILHYLDGLSVAETAKKLHATDSAVTWHLFDAQS